MIENLLLKADSQQFSLLNFFVMLSAAKTSESDTPSVFCCVIANVFANSDAFAALSMTKNMVKNYL
jgi:hypothetical protein